jgi:hypothetical protein
MSPWRSGLTLAALLAVCVHAEPVSIRFECDNVAGPKECASELALCLAFPRPWVPRSEARRFACEHCWAEAYRCYADCGKSFPMTFSGDCLAACPRKFFDVCSPRLAWRIPGDSSPPTPTPSDTPVAAPA